MNVVGLEALALRGVKGKPDEPLKALTVNFDGECWVDFFLFLFCLSSVDTSLKRWWICTETVTVNLRGESEPLRQVFFCFLLISLVSLIKIFFWRRRRTCWIDECIIFHKFSFFIWFFFGHRLFFWRFVWSILVTLSLRRSRNLWILGIFEGPEKERRRSRWKKRCTDSSSKKMHWWTDCLRG